MKRPRRLQSGMKVQALTEKMAETVEAMKMGQMVEICHWCWFRSLSDV
jgi:hypothetical protein